MKTLLLAALLFCRFVPNLYAQAAVTVDVGKQLKALNGREVGVNLDYLMDGGITNPTTPIATSLKNMGVKLVRYPGGEKSDNYLWSAAPWKAASPRMALLDTVKAWPTKDDRFVNKTSPEKACKPIVLDFDELMTVCKASGTEPLIVVAYDAMYNSVVTAKPTKAQLITNAVEWVRYANITKKFGIKYWMIGNESWNLPDYNGRTTPTQYAADLQEFASAMKAIDPSIKIVANGQASWWRTLLQSTAAPLIDVLAFSSYPVDNYPNGYDTYRTSTPNLTLEIDKAVDAINTYATAADKARIKVLASEYNSIDFSGGWSNDNNLGHALCNFQILGDMVVNPKVESACLWNTRWTTNDTEPQNIYDALDKAGKLNAIGVAQQVWGKNLYSAMVTTTSSDNQVRVYASFDAGSKKLNIFLLNKDVATKTVNVSLSNYPASYRGSKYVFTGKTVSDKFPTFTRTDTITKAADVTSLTLAPASVTVLKLAVSYALVTLSSFTGTVANSDMQLQWQAASDFGISYYSVERKTSGAFAGIGTVPGADATPASYNFTDTTFAPEVSTSYRLKLVHLNGEVTYSDTLNFTATAVPGEPSSTGTAVLVTVAPNPAQGQVQLQATTGAAQSVTMRVVDATGRTWAFEKVQLRSGTTNVKLPGTLSLPRGVYWLQVTTKKQQKALPFLKM